MNARSNEKSAAGACSSDVGFPDKPGTLRQRVHARTHTHTHRRLCQEQKSKERKRGKSTASVRKGKRKKEANIINSGDTQAGGEREGKEGMGGRKAEVKKLENRKSGNRMAAEASSLLLSPSHSPFLDLSRRREDREDERKGSRIGEANRDSRRSISRYNAPRTSSLFARGCVCVYVSVNALC